MSTFMVISAYTHATDDLYHYGVKGMKWGVRKAYTPDKKSGALTKKSKKPHVKITANKAHVDSGKRRTTIYGEYDPYARSGAFVRNMIRKLGDSSASRLRSESSDSYNRGHKYYDEYDWDRISTSKIDDAYREYRDSEDWG